MPKLIEYQKADSFDPLISWLNKNKPNVKYTLKAEYVKNGRKHEADCGAMSSGDPIIVILYYLLSNQIYSTGKGVYNPSITLLAPSTGGTNINASTTWLSGGGNFGLAYTGNFTLKFSTTIISTFSGTDTLSQLSINFYYGQNSSGTPNYLQFIINTQSGTACNISISAGTVITWTLTGSVNESNTNATASWYAILWNEIWAEFIAATGVPNAPTGLWKYPNAGVILFAGYNITLYDSNSNVIGAYNSSPASSTAISNPTLNPGTNPFNTTGLKTAPYVSFTFTPTSSTTLQTIVVNINVNGTPPSPAGTIFANNGGLQLKITNINQPVSAGQQYSITLTDNVSVSGST